MTPSSSQFTSSPGLHTRDKCGMIVLLSANWSAAWCGLSPLESHSTPPKMAQAQNHASRTKAAIRHIHFWQEGGKPIPPIPRLGFEPRWLDGALSRPRHCRHKFLDPRRSVGSLPPCTCLPHPPAQSSSATKPHGNRYRKRLAGVCSRSLAKTPKDSEFPAESDNQPFVLS